MVLDGLLVPPTSNLDLAKMPVNFQALPTSEPNLDMPQEPFFTRKKKVDNGRKVTFIFNHSTDVSVAAAEDNPAQRFRAGYRRANSSGNPTCYQIHYCRRPPGQTSQPILDAVEILGRARKSPSPDRCPPMAVRRVSPRIHFSECPLSKEKHGGETELVGNSPRPPFVKPLALPLSDNKETQTTASIKHDSAHDSRQPIAKPEESSKPPTHDGNGPSGGGKKVRVTRKMRRSPSPLKRLYQSDRQRCQDVFETEYRSHYKDWVGEKWRARRQGGKRKEKNVTSLSTYECSPVTTDSTDPRLLKHSPPPTIPHQPSKSHWLTQYKMHFVEPRQYKYEKGAFISADTANAPVTPPQVPPATESNGANEEARPSSSWFDQLLELRKKAKHYKWKSEHSSFQPHHLVQQGPLGASEDHGSISSCTSSSQPQSLSISTPLTPSPTPTASNKDFGMEGRAFVNTGHGPAGTQAHSKRDEPLLIKDVESESELVAESSPQISAEEIRKSRTSESCLIYKEPPPATLDPLQSNVGVECSCLTRTGAKSPFLSAYPGSGEDKGRIPTSELQKSTSSKMRHHLDRTTPSSNNLLISSPRDHPPRSVDVARVIPSASVTFPRMKNSIPLHASSYPAPPPLEEDDPVINHKKEAEDVLLINRHSDKILGTGGRDLPRHTSGTHSPGHLACRMPGGNTSHLTTTKNYNTAAVPMQMSAAATSSSPRTNTLVANSTSVTLPAASARARKPARDYAAGRSQSGIGGLAMTDYGSNSCKTSGLGMKPALSTGVSQKSSNPFKSKTTRGRDYIAPVTVAARPCAHHGRSCDQENSLCQHLQKSQLENCRQLEKLEKIREDFASRTSQQRPGEHVEGRVYASPSHTSLSLRPCPGHTCHSPDSKSTLYQSMGNDEELLSVSPLSTSSCSVASDILEKAKHRRDHFWASQRQPSE